MVYSAAPDGTARLWLRRLDEAAATPLEGTEGGRYPFWAPDSRAIGFFGGGKLRRLDLPGGRPQDLADAPAARGGAWGASGVILFAPVQQQTGLMQVAAQGGPVMPATRWVQLESGVLRLPDRNTLSDRFPVFLPDGRRFLFRRGGYIFIGSLDSTDVRPLLEVDADAAFAPPGHVVFVRRGALWVAPVDLERQTAGEPVPVVQNIGWDPAFNKGAFSLASNGLLAYRLGGQGRRQLRWFDRNGRRLAAVGEPDEANLLFPDLSPDERRLAVQREFALNDLWLVDVQRGASTRFSAAGAWPTWSADARRLVYGTESKGWSLVEKSANNGAERTILSSPTRVVPTDWSSDGRYLLYQQYIDHHVDIRAVSMTGNGAAVEITQGEVASQAQFSPDGRWVAYRSEGTAREEVYVRRFPGPSAVWRVTPAGGGQPRWRGDGRELYYVSGDGRLTAVSFDGRGDAPIIGDPTSLFPVNVPKVLARAQYDVSSDGTRFLVNTIVDSLSPIVVEPEWLLSFARE